MDDWNCERLSKSKPTKKTVNEYIKKQDAKLAIGLTAFKKRMKRNLPKSEYRKQMKILEMLTESDMEDCDEEKEDHKVLMYKQFQK